MNLMEKRIKLKSCKPENKERNDEWFHWIITYAIL